jgi:hypothetical protein
VCGITIMTWYGTLKHNLHLVDVGFLHDIDILSSGCYYIRNSAGEFVLAVKSWNFTNISTFDGETNYALLEAI